jgi:hypothetical protein
MERIWSGVVPPAWCRASAGGSDGKPGEEAETPSELVRQITDEAQAGKIRAILFDNARARNNMHQRMEREREKMEEIRPN